MQFASHLSICDANSTPLPSSSFKDAVLIGSKKKNGQIICYSKKQTLNILYTVM